MEQRHVAHRLGDRVGRSSIYPRTPRRLKFVELPRASGVVCAAITVARDGAVTNLRWTCDTLTPIPLPELPSETEIRDAIMLDIAEALLELRFPESDGESVITLPFCFE